MCVQDGLYQSALHLTPSSHPRTPFTHHPHRAFSDTSLDATPIPHESPRGGGGGGTEEAGRGAAGQSLNAGRSGGHVGLAEGGEGGGAGKEQHMDVVALALEQARGKIVYGGGYMHVI